MSADSSPVSPGEVLAGKYRVDRVLGSGGMGVVVAATHVDLGQRVALKFLLPQALANAEAAARFLREARAAVKIESEHVARVLDVGRLESGAPYMVMEYLEGHDLSNHPKGAELPIETAVEFLLQACEAMAVAHTSGIVHRDLKPANLFLTTRPDGSSNVKVLDFGISKVTEMDGSDKALTHTSSVMGSPLYMSPEQMRSARNVDARTDVWALGAILYELLTGEPPFNGETLGEVFAGVMTMEPPPMRSKRAGIPDGLSRAVLRALAKDPGARFQNVAELANALGEFAPPKARVLVDRASGILGRAGIQIALPVKSGEPLVGARTANAWTETGAGGSPPKRGLVWVAVGVALLAALGGVVFAVGRQAPEPEPRAAPAAVAPVATPAAAVATEPAKPAESTAPSVVPAPAVSPSPATPVVAPVSPPARSPTVARTTAKARAPQPAARTVAPPPPNPAPPVAVSLPAPKPAPAPKKNPLSIDFK